MVDDETYERLKTGVMPMPSHPSPKYPHRLDTVIPLVIAEYDRVQAQRGAGNMPDSDVSDLDRLATLVDEMGRVALCMKKPTRNDRPLLKEQLIRMSMSALSWASICR